MLWIVPAILSYLWNNPGFRVRTRYSEISIASAALRHTIWKSLRTAKKYGVLRVNITIHDYTLSTRLEPQPLLERLCSKDVQESGDLWRKMCVSVSVFINIPVSNLLIYGQITGKLRPPRVLIDRTDAECHSASFYFSAFYASKGFALISDVRFSVL